METPRLLHDYFPIAVFVAKIVPGSSEPKRICGILDDMLKIKVSVSTSMRASNVL